VQVRTHVSGQNDALGNFPVQLTGVVRPATGAHTGPTVNPYPNNLGAVDPGGPLVFEGTMSWSDTWDFDSKLQARLKRGGTHRPPTAEIAVAAVAALVDGVPFLVTSRSVAMTQYSGRFPAY